MSHFSLPNCKFSFSVTVICPRSPNRETLPCSYPKKAYRVSVILVLNTPILRKSNKLNCTLPWSLAHCPVIITVTDSDEFCCTDFTPKNVISNLETSAKSHIEMIVTWSKNEPFYIYDTTYELGFGFRQTNEDDHAMNRSILLVVTVCNIARRAVNKLSLILFKIF